MKLKDTYSLGKQKAMTNPDSILKCRDITSLTKVCLVTAMFFCYFFSFTSSHAWMWELNHKEGWVPKNWCLQIVVLEKTLKNPLGKSILREINPEYSLEGLMLSWNSNALTTWCAESTHWKRPWCWERLRAEGEEGIRGWDGWMTSLMQWTWTWANFRRW